MEVNEDLLIDRDYIGLYFIESRSNAKSYCEC